MKDWRFTWKNPDRQPTDSPVRRLGSLPSVGAEREKVKKDGGGKNGKEWDVVER